MRPKGTDGMTEEELGARARMLRATVELLAEGAIGQVTWFRGEHTEDFLSDPQAPACAQVPAWHHPDAHCSWWKQGPFAGTVPAAQVPAAIN